MPPTDQHTANDTHGAPPAADARLTAFHWGLYRAAGTPAAPQLLPDAGDPAPSLIGEGMLEAYRSPLRVLRPAARAGWLARLRDPARAAADDDRPRRGAEEFVELEWDEALDLAARELSRVRGEYGNAAIFGGSYGWSSAGRFHHAQSQVHRFLNCFGGYVRHVDSYSLGAGRALLPHVVMDMDELMASHSDWNVLAAHTRLFVAFGGVPAKNAQVAAGGALEHRLRPALAALAAAGCRFVNFSPVADNLDAPAHAVEWIPIRPNTDTAVMLALAHTLIAEGRHDEDFLARHCVGFERWRAYLFGADDGVAKDAEWAAALSGVPAARLRALAAEMAATRCLINCAWALQRAEHGEQPFWATIALAAVLGQIGLPGGGFGLAYGALNQMGSPHARVPGPTLPQGRNGVDAFIPVARLTDMLERPGEPFDYNGKRQPYPHIRLVYWAGGNPFHHHQDLNRLVRAWKRPQTVIAHEQFWNAHARMADLVLPATAAPERDDIAFATREPVLAATRRIVEPPGQARDDYAIFAALAERLGIAEAFTEGRDAAAWLAHLYGEAAQRAAERGSRWPAYAEFRAAGRLDLREIEAQAPVLLLADFRRNPTAHPLPTPSGRIELHSATVAGFGYADCPGHPVWREPGEWLGAAAARQYPLHLISDQPATRLHSQLDHGPASRASKIAGREPIHLNPADAAARGIADGDLVRVHNARGACLAGARLDAAVMPGVARLSTGAWYDPLRPGAHDPANLDKHGNPNVLTRDVGSSRLGQGCTAHTCLVEVERHAGPVPELSAFDPPRRMG
ncbi:molybdopterin-dependent oxidoreductase [Pseudothauera rhizosphaerae]|uniref:Asp-tRNA(Asn)/Glu-tRNA(Gln) amidotransferase GatCAB subunit C n=1 Tax=Pseudothauera rhizosphaerae TaxID=2565932 RepID=A0A4S4AYL3_9RHOO|nr:molybdopterin-dependent oxidoreductase [Pseudothauera rhizosphaerae]THF65228.1 Asp-tRNA(Asn)/Glu-tRNA(Gln) amidotransferase GatCAB subunit C [Pseudothauera rhizosphaerae]